MRHFVEECTKVKDWFVGSGRDTEEIRNRLWDDQLDRIKGRILRKLWKENEKEMMKFKEDSGIV